MENLYNYNNSAELIWLVVIVILIAIIFVLIRNLVYSEDKIIAISRDLQIANDVIESKDILINESEKKIEFYQNERKKIEEERRADADALKELQNRIKWHNMKETPEPNELVCVWRRLLGGEPNVCLAGHDGKEWHFSKPWALHSEGWCYLSEIPFNDDSENSSNK